MFRAKHSHRIATVLHLGVARQLFNIPIKSHCRSRPLTRHKSQLSQKLQLLAQQENDLSLHGLPGQSLGGETRVGRSPATWIDSAITEATTASDLLEDQSDSGESTETVDYQTAKKITRSRSTGYILEGAAVGKDGRKSTQRGETTVKQKVTRTRSLVLTPTSVSRGGANRTSRQSRRQISVTPVGGVAGFDGATAVRAPTITAGSSVEETGDADEDEASLGGVAADAKVSPAQTNVGQSWSHLRSPARGDLDLAIVSGKEPPGR